MRTRGLALVISGAVVVVVAALVATGTLTVPGRADGMPSPDTVAPASTAPASTAASAPPASPGSTPPGQTTRASAEVAFSDPWSRSTAAQYRLHTIQIAAINAAPKGATIRLVMYTLATEPVGRALLSAYRRGVHVRMIIDDHANYRWTMRLQRAIGTDQRRSSYVVRCHLACASDITYPRRRSKGTIRPYVHAKWLLVDRSGSDRHISMIPSENLTPAATEQSNDILVLRGDKAVYDFLVERFDIMRKDRGSAYGTVTSGTRTLTMYPMPLPSGYRIDPDSPLPAAMDPYLDHLRDVQCGGSRSTSIRIAMYMWTYPRLAVAERFAALARAGCRVVAIGQPLSPEHDEGWDPEINRVLLAAGVELHQTDGGGVYLHSKIVTLDGWTTAGERLKLAITGSSNFLLQALVASDDLVVTDTDPRIVDAYSAHVDELIARHSRPAN